MSDDQEPIVLDRLALELALALTLRGATVIGFERWGQAVFPITKEGQRRLQEDSGEDWHHM